MKFELLCELQIFDIDIAALLFDEGHPDLATYDIGHISDSKENYRCRICNLSLRALSGTNCGTMSLSRKLRNPLTYL